MSYIYTHTHTHTHTHIYIYIYIYIYVCVCMVVCVYVCVSYIYICAVHFNYYVHFLQPRKYIYPSIHTHTHTHTHTHIRVCVSVYVCMYGCIYTFILTVRTSGVEIIFIYIREKRNNKFPASPTLPPSPPPSFLQFSLSSSSSFSSREMNAESRDDVLKRPIPAAPMPNVCDSNQKTFQLISITASYLISKQHSNCNDSIDCSGQIFEVSLIRRQYLHFFFLVSEEIS